MIALTPAVALTSPVRNASQPGAVANPTLKAPSNACISLVGYKHRLGETSQVFLAWRG